jgi:hypothetical protein
MVLQAIAHVGHSNTLLAPTGRDNSVVEAEHENQGVRFLPHTNEGQPKSPV